MTDSQAQPDPVTSAFSDGAETSPQSGVLEQDGPARPGDSAGGGEEHGDDGGQERGADTPPESAAEEPEHHEVATLVGATVATRGQLPAARVLRDSFLQNHPGAGFVLLLLDWPESVAERDRGVLTPVDIGVDRVEFARLALARTAEQLRATLRPRLLAQLLRSGSTVLSLEPSVQVFGSFEQITADLTPQTPVALVPRVLRPLRIDGFRPSTADLAEQGTFDPGMFAVAPGAEQFLQSWMDHVRAEPVATGTFLDGAPALVDHRVVRDPGVGLSAWNATQRELAPSDGGHAVDGEPLRSIHFDGFQPLRPWLLSASYADRPRVLLSEHPELARLCAIYRNALVDAGCTEQEQHRFDTLPDGAVVPEPLRREYGEAWAAGDPPVSPFEPATADRQPVDEFLEWACAPADERQRAAGGSRWTAAAWSGDPVLRRDFPDPFGADAEAFHEWCVGVGIASARVPAAAVRQRESRGSLVDQLGVAVLGSGRLAALVRAAVRSSGLPTADSPHYPVVLRCDSRTPVPAGRHLIDVRLDARASDDAAETWVLSETSRHAVRLASGSTGSVARVLTLPVPDEGQVLLSTRKGVRARYGFSDEFVVGTGVDHSDERQANVLGVVSAFLTAFPDRQDVRLLVGVGGSGSDPEAAERLRLATASDPRIVLVEDETERADLFRAVDCALSLHRAEGTGGDRYALDLLEVAAHGVPVLASDHGAVAELLGNAGAVLVPCHGAGEPDVEAAVRSLREAAEDPEGTADFGLRAREQLLSQHSAHRAGEQLRERVEHAYRDWRAKWSKDRHGHREDPLHPLLVARHALHRAPDVGMNTRNAMTPALRKAVLRALSHYDEHIRDVMRSLVDGVERTASELLRRQYEVDGGGDFESVRTELAQLGQRHDELASQFTGADESLVRVRAELAEHQRRLREVESTATAPAGGAPGASDDKVDALARRIDELTSVVERTLDRLSAVEDQRAEDTISTDLEAGLRSASYEASHALQRTDVLQRVLLREHERNTGSADGTSSPVLCDAGLLRLPADDAMMLPWLSSHATWDAEVSALIDSLLEPDGIFLDVGSYIGYQSTRVLSRIGTSGAVVAVEPSERACELLRHNAEMNVPPGSAEGLTVVEAAAWDAHTQLVAEPSLAGGLAVRPDLGPDESGQEPSPDAVAVRAVRLDRELEHMAKLEGQRLSVIHVDVGACVHRVLGGLVRLLRRDRPSVVCSFTPSAITRLGADPAAALREFGTWGYDLVPVGRDGAVSPDELLAAIEAAAGTNTVKLWLRPRG